MLFTYDPSGKEISQVDEQTFASFGIKERSDIEEWVLKNPMLIQEDLLIVTSEYSGFETNDRLDILGMDREGVLVVIELKCVPAPSRCSFLDSHIQLPGENGTTTGLSGIRVYRADIRYGPANQEIR